MRRVSGFVALILLVGSGGVLAWINRAPAPAVPEVPAPAAAPGPGTQAAASGTEGPGFDLVRVEQDGAAVVAGTAVPGSRVTILADEQPLAEVVGPLHGVLQGVVQLGPLGPLHPVQNVAAAGLGEVVQPLDALGLDPLVRVAPGRQCSHGADPMCGRSARGR